MAYIDIHCVDCDHVEVDYRVTLDEVSYDIPHVCPRCGGQALRVVTMPALMGKEAVRDGVKRPGFEQLKKKLDLQIESYGKAPHERYEYQQEIKALERDASNEISRKGKDYDQ